MTLIIGRVVVEIFTNTFKATENFKSKGVAVESHSIVINKTIRID